MNIIIKVAQMTVVFIVMNGTGNAANPNNDTNNMIPDSGATSCKIAPKQNVCYMFMLDPSIELPTNTDTSDFNKIALNPRPQNKTESFRFTVIAHHGDESQTRGALKNKGFMSASFGLYREAHNESLKIVDGETSNEHAQVNLLIPFEAMPTIENYVQFFASPGYFTITK